MPRSIYLKKVRVKDLSPRGYQLYELLNWRYGRIFSYQVEIKKAVLADMIDKFLINNCNKNLTSPQGIK